MESYQSEIPPNKWELQKEILKQRFKRITDQDLNFEESRKNEMMGRLARRLGMTTREIQRVIDSIL